MCAGSLVADSALAWQRAKRRILPVGRGKACFVKKFILILIAPLAASAVAAVLHASFEAA